MPMAETSGNVRKPYVMAALGRCLKLGDPQRLDLIKMNLANLPFLIFKFY